MAIILNKISTQKGYILILFLFIYLLIISYLLLIIEITQNSKKLISDVNLNDNMHKKLIAWHKKFSITINKLHGVQKISDGIYIRYNSYPIYTENCWVYNNHDAKRRVKLYQFNAIMQHRDYFEKIQWVQAISDNNCVSLVSSYINALVLTFREV